MNTEPVSRKTYSFVFVALLVLLAASLGAARLDLGRWNTSLALSFSLVKAILIMVFFMHLRHSSPLVRLIAVGGFVWIAILFVVTLGEFETRIPDDQPAVVDRPEKAPPGSIRMK